MSLKARRYAGRIAVGAALMVGPIIGCSNDDYYPTYYGGSTSGFFGGSSGVSSSSGGKYFRDSGPEICETAKENDSCYGTRASTFCEQGESANANCNAHLVCGDDTWSKDPPQRAICAPTSACPSTYTETVPDELCKRPDAISLLCEYDEGTCGCAPVGGVDRGATDFPAKKDAGAKDAGGDASSDAGDAGAKDAGKADAGPRTYEWKCVQPDRDAGCPRRRPREGIDCVRPINCDYGFCVFEDGYRMDCYSGSWVRDLSRSEQCDQ